MTEADWLSSPDLRVLRQCVFRNVDPVSTRKVRLFVVACCRKIWPLLTDPRSRAAVELAEALADGMASKPSVMACRKAARAAFSELSERRAGGGVVMAARAAAETLAPGRQETGAASDHAASAAVSLRHYDGPVRPSTIWHEDIEAEQREQVPFFRDIFSNPFRPVTFDPRWRTSDAIGLARAIYDDRTFDRLPILADALIDAGCDDEQVHAHCRSEGPHVRGCWVVDLVLGRE
jgi:hypothetical protein